MGTSDGRTDTVTERRGRDHLVAAHRRITASQVQPDRVGRMTTGPSCAGTMLREDRTSDGMTGEAVVGSGGPR